MRSVFKLSKFFILIRIAISRIHSDNHVCVICGHKLFSFMPYRGGWYDKPTLMRLLDIIGSDLDHFECPWCGCHDRERHLMLYMQRTAMLSFVENKQVLHFAPERYLSRIIKDANPVEYIKCDLYPQTNDIKKIDMLSMPFENEVFDLLIANHVLEHVADDQKAISEITRVLKPGGYAILQTPFSAVLEHTWFDEGVNSKEARLQAYGQEDHVRLFGRDIFSRFIAQGLECEAKEHEEILADISDFKYGVNKREPFFLFRKPFANC